MRECGFYWVRYASEGKGEIAYWNGRYWELTGNENWFHDKEFSEIDEKQIKRESLIQFEIDILSKCVKHPTKPGYERNDIVDRIKELEKQLNE